MSRLVLFVLFFAAIFLQAGAYGLTFMLPRLFAAFGSDEKAVGAMLLITAVSTLIAVYFAGHLADKFGRIRTLGSACAVIALALFLYARAQSVGPGLVGASALLGAGWGLTYALAPVALTRLVLANERVRYFALLSVFVMAGSGLAPVMAAGLERLGLTVAGAFAINGMLCTVSAALFFILAAPIRKYSQETGYEARSSLTLASVAAVMRSTALIPIAMVCLGASVVAGINNFQTVFADARDLDYSIYFLAYTSAVIAFRLLLVGFKGGPSPYLTITALLSVMGGSVVLFIFSGSDETLYILVAVLFGIGYGVSYPILVAMAADDADRRLVPQTLQLFALTYFVGIFGFPLIAGWVIVEVGTTPLLVLVAILAGIETIMAARRAGAG